MSKVETITVTSAEIMKAAKTGTDLIMSQLNPGDSIKSFYGDKNGNHVIKIVRDDTGGR